MMKKILTATFLLLTATMAIAQNDERADQFVRIYADREISLVRDPNANQLNKPAPDFYFDEKLNSQSLRGKVIVLDFWATWCGGCLVVSHDLDSQMVRDTDVYLDRVQIIGVNTKEKMIDKGYNAREWWKSKKKGFPMVDGPAADSCAASVNNGFPTVILIDGEGIMRARWDGAGPVHTANSIRVVAWRYGLYPLMKDMQASVENVQKMMARRDWVSALFLCESMPEDDDQSMLKFSAMLNVNESKAASFANKLKEKMTGDTNANQRIRKLIDAILATPTENYHLFNFVLKSCTELKDKAGFNTDTYYSDQLNLVQQRITKVKEKQRIESEEYIRKAKSATIPSTTKQQ